MARLLRAARGALLPSALHSTPVARPIPTRGWASQIAEMRKSAFRENLLRILREEIDYESNLRPPKEPAKRFNSFTVEEHPGEQFMRLRRNFGEEEIKVDVTMFDGYSMTPPNEKTDDPGGDTKLHMSLIIDVSKGKVYNGILQFICSAWPDALMAEKLFIYRRDPAPLKPFMGPDFKELDEELQEAFMAYLDERGINDELAAFLHEYVANKVVCEHLRWLDKVKAYIQK